MAQAARRGLIHTATFLMSSDRPPPSAHHGHPGRVLFVGAGPGDPELLTVRAVDCLRSADVVVYDTLVPQNVLDLVPPSVTRLAVPRDGRDGDGDPGEAIGRLLVQLAAEARTVVRLKGGDPAVFGRLTEEMGPVRDAAIPIEIVPGVTAAVAAAAAAGIPLTSRSAASSLTILTGHEAADKREGIDFQQLAELLVVVNKQILIRKAKLAPIAAEHERAVACWHGVVEAQ